MTSKTPKEKCTCQYEKNNGHSFECPLYEPNNPVYEANIPMGASQWKQHGLKYGYWNFFETEIRKDWQEEFTKTLNSGRKLYELGKAETKDKIIEMVEKLDDTGGGSGRRLKLQLLDKIKNL